MKYTAEQAAGIVCFIFFGLLLWAALTNNKNRNG